VIRPTHATVDILAIVSDTTNNKQPHLQPLYEVFSATLRTNEIRPNSSLEVEISDCIRPLDIVLARIHALGEKDYILSTVEAELGVIKAVCESSGKEMKAISWKEMECVETGVREGRKVAKPKVVG
jgi:exosome complex component CSL4